jgi:ABC-type multidrug transport system fused ATPase/permease subunit
VSSLSAVELCEVSDSTIPVSKQRLATQKYRSANHWFWSGFKRYPGLFLVSLVLSIINAILGVVPNILIGLGIDYLSKEGFSNTFVLIAVLIMVTAVITWVVSFLGAYTWMTASFRLERDARQEFFEVIQEHSMAFHDEHDSGVLLSMGMNEIG